MQHYIATYWNGSDWMDLHTDPLPFRAAETMATSALLDGRGTTRLRCADQPDPLTCISANQIAALYVYADRYGADWKNYLVIEWQLATAPPALHQLRDTHGATWLEKLSLPLRSAT